MLFMKKRWSQYVLGALVVAGMLFIPTLITVAAAEPIVLDGLIEPFEVVDVGSSVRGVIEAIEVERGDLVTKGQVLARLEAGVERATMELARARSEMETLVREKQAMLEFSLRKQKRAEELYKENVIPIEQIDEARTSVSLAMIELENAKEDLRLAALELERSIAVVDRMTIKSPIAGVVMERFLAPGEFVEDQPVLKLAQINKLNVEVFVPVELVGRFKVGMRADVTVSEPVVHVFEAKVTIVDRVVDAASGTFGMRLELPNRKYELPAGLKCRVTFQ
jgi:RND family efflux transporter MFP subunit